MVFLLLTFWDEEIEIIYLLTPVRMAAIKKSTNNAGEGVEKKESSYTVGGNVNRRSQYEQYVNSFKK